MNRLPEIELMRLLHGELSPERAFELHERLAREPELAEELRRLEATWDRLELPPAAPTPRGFARAVVSRAQSGGLWRAAPTRVRATGFALLATGLALGVGIATAVVRLGVGTESAAGTVAFASPSVSPATETSPGTPGPNAAGSNETPRAPISPNVPDGPTPTPSGGTTSGPPPNAATAPRMADLDYDLPADDGSFADEGTFSDDFWQAFDETDAGASMNPDSGSGSEGL